SFHRASTTVTSQYLGSNTIAVSAAAHYNGYRPQSGDLRSESVLVDFNFDPLDVLEDWADNVVKVVKPKFLRDTRTGLLNTWYIYGNEISEERALTQAR